MAVGLVRMTMAKKNLNDCRSGKDFINYAAKQGAEVSNGKGSHHKVKTEKGTCIVPHHNKDLPTGTRCGILKVFLRIGIMMFLLLLVLLFMIGGAL